jgi:hypothetical protein
VENLPLRKNLNISHGGRVAAVAWISFQPDGSISFGLRDKTFILESAKIRQNLWNAYNRIEIQYVAPKATEPLLAVSNLHFTFHPPIRFHLKSNEQLVSQDEEIFSGIADIGITLQQQTEMPWIRATSAPLAELSQAQAARNDGIETEGLAIDVPAVMLSASARIEIDFIRPNNVALTNGPVWEFEWHGVGIRISLGYVSPQIATLSWFHSA